MQYAIHIIPRLPSDSVFEMPEPDDPRVRPWCLLLQRVGAWKCGKTRMSVRVTEEHIMLRYEWNHKLEEAK